MNRHIKLGMALIGLALAAACAREPAPEGTATAVPEETGQLIVRPATEGAQEAEGRSVDPGFTLPAGDGAGDSGMEVPVPDAIADPRFHIPAEPEE